MTGDVGERLPDDVLERRHRLPRMPDPVTLSGRLVRLVPLDLDRDVAPLHAISNGEPATAARRSVEAYDADALVWRYMAGGPFANAAGLGDWLRAHVDAPAGLCLTVFDVASGDPVGVVNYMNNEPAHLKIELGGIWYGPVAQRSGANTEATYLLLRHAFELGYRRVEWKCDALNERSRRSALRMGFRYEGTQESHFIVKGRNRDTAWFRILAREWADVEARLKGLLE